MELDKIRNFCIIAHVDHGKSTLADRMLEITGTVPRDKMHPQMLDTMDLEREKGITIKLQPVTMVYRPSNSKHEALSTKQIQNSKNQNNSDSLEFRNSDLEFANSAYTLNLIDTPGHVDFSYEVSRSLAAVEGAVLLVDATKGIQAQTLANLHIAQEHNLTILPAINKIDLTGAEVEETKKEIAKIINIDEADILECSAKTGEGVEKILERIISDIPAPKGDRAGELKALIFDSVFDEFRGAIAYVRVFDGAIKAGEKIKFLAAGKIEKVEEIGKFDREFITKGFGNREAGLPAVALAKAGDIGYIVAGAKDISEIKVGDTITSDSPLSVSPIAGFKIPRPFVYASFYCQGGDPSLLRKSLEKLSLNDSSLNFTPEVSQSFGQGFRLGFLGLLHMEIIKERLEREYGLDLIVTQPQVAYKTYQEHGQTKYEEPWVRLEIITPEEYVGPVMELAQSRRAIYLDTKYLGETGDSYHARTILEYEAPLAEIIVDFYDTLKSVSQGYASQNYEVLEYRKSDLVKMDILIAGEKVEEFSRIVPRSRIQSEGKNIVTKLKELIPRQMFEVSLQAALGGKIIARENISAMKKDVTAKLYGGDRTRKDKLLKKQAKGKKKMKRLGRVDIPDNVFIDILKS